MYTSLYRFLSYAGGPLIDFYLMRRKQVGKEDPKRYTERLGHPGFPRMSGPLVWVHAASVGEGVSVLPLIKAVVNKYRDVNVLLTTGTVTSAKVLESRLPKRAFHQYAPIDKLVTVRRFLDHWRPDLALWVESELWPNMIIETHRRGCPLIQINARLSPNSYEKWQKYNSLARDMLICFSLSLAQSEEDVTRLKKLGAPNAKCLGNLKFDAPALPADPKETGKLVTATGERPMWVAASTHPGEDELIADAHIKLKLAHDKILTVIIPRHPERGEDIERMLKEKKLTVARRSQKQDIEENTDIYIADTIGELGIFYRMAGITFMGGSLVEHGGQNPLEAARLECALLVGPHTASFTDIYNELEKEHAVIRVRDSDALAEKVGVLLSDHEKQEDFASRAMKLMASKSGILEHYMDALSPYLKPISRDIAPDEDA